MRKNQAKNDNNGFWRSVDENKSELRGGDGNDWEFRMTRRSFLKLAGAQVVMASLAGCVKPLEKIVPYVRSPEEIVPGKPLYFASALSSEGFARGILVETHTGRPTKIEGNPSHPDSLGATDPIAQAAVYQLYDPARSRSIIHAGLPSTIPEFINALRARLDVLKGSGGQGLRFLSRPIISPALGYLRRQVLAQFPAARWHQYSPLHPDLALQALMNLYGSALQPVYRLQEANVLLAIESDLLTAGPGAMAYSRAFAARRETRPDRMDLSRIYAVESSPTLTGAAADHRLILPPSHREAFAAGLLETVQTGGSATAALLPAREQRFLGALAHDLQNNRSRSLVVAGPEQPVNIQMLAARLNEVLQNNGRTVSYTPVMEEFAENNAASLAALVNDLNSGTVSDLIIIDGNPVYASPAGLGFAQACGKTQFLAHLGLYYDETAELAQWHIPMADELESWGDMRAFDGTVTVRQPVIAPLYNGVTDYELCLAFLPGRSPAYDEVIRSFWQGRLNRPDFEAFWKQTLHDGVMPGSAFKPLAVAARGNMPQAAAPAAPQWSLQFRPDPHILDGRFFHNSWLQELPKPLTKLTWGNAALISPTSAAQLKLKEGDLVEIATKAGTVDAPVYILPGQADGVLTVHLGYGRKHPGNAGVLGFNAYLLQNGVQPYETTDFTFRKKRKTTVLATTQHHGMLSGARHLVLVADLSQYIKAPQFVRKLIRVPERSETLYHPEEHLKGGYQWAMCIDLNRCTGCGACTIACQVENNIAVVGKKEVKRNREMHWIRVDRYFRGRPDEPEIHHQPVPCMHCEDAPCELVCPVEATSHSSEGLNEMTYNRCVGTRYCSNNCPYKVRRFNFFEYNHLSSSQYQGKNPDVTIRSRGVMEKCTYCLQRISAARIAARREHRRVRDGEIIPACAQACPTGAIVFGDIRDTASQVSLMKASPLNYGMLEETGARPRTTYIAKIRNLNKELT